MADKTKVTKNPLALKWPSDPQGINGPLRDGGLKTIQRIRGDETKMRNFLATVELMVAHAKARYAADVSKRKVSKDNSVAARLRVAEKRKEEAEAKAREYELAAERVRVVAGIKPVEPEVKPEAE